MEPNKREIPNDVPKFLRKIIQDKRDIKKALKDKKSLSELAKEKDILQNFSFRQSTML